MADSRDLEETDVFLSEDEFAHRFFAPKEPALQYSFGAASHVGEVRPNNEDHFAVIQRRRSSELVMSNLKINSNSFSTDSSFAAIVADGMGGERFGEFASRVALETMFDLANHATSWVMRFTDFEAQQIRQRVRAYVDQLQSTMREYIQSDPALAGMGTTWTSALCLSHDVLIVHIGDSRAYTLRQKELRQITHDETVAQAFVDAGKAPQSVKQFRHLLLNHFGGDKQQVSAQIYHVRVEPGDRLLLCTDGLTDMIPDDHISRTLQSHADPQEATDELVKQALLNGGKDNVTVVVAAVK
ncbi:PP2C family protein-serine/threonine phosphatase [Bythopirellula goksoeyrii]|uniref:Serine/threonine phosphatase stp n=1 Tax=Bythopirellula goksoeyrii TaxID=1400387 RepID=A0A5B9QAD5_9BACT|nr:protein phosphatase 2C domain-containing protein [Bythopirellula goksoeyrii]QEG35937.1 Serine/threonine phosphatase stp [Bythopirellula goksoeyrii]